MINKMISNVGGGIAKLDLESNSIKVGTDAGLLLGDNDTHNIAIGVKALDTAGASSVSGQNIAIGSNAGHSITSGDNNIVIGYNTGDTITSGSANTLIGNYSDGLTGANYQTALGYLAIPQNSYETRIGHYGAYQSMTIETATTSSTSLKSSSDDDNDVAHTASLVKIPAYSVIKNVSVVVTQLSNLATYNLALFIADDTTRSDDEGLTNGIEILGAGVANTRSSAVAFSGTSPDIVAGASAGVVNTSYYSEPDIVFDSAAGASTDRYLWVVNAGTDNGDTDGSTAARLRICIEFAGQD